MFEQYNDVLQDYPRKVTKQVIDRVFDDDAFGSDVVERYRHRFPGRVSANNSPNFMEKYRRSKESPVRA